MLRNTWLIVLIVLTTGSVSRADDEAEKWLKFFVGDWKREREIWMQGGEKETDTAKWSCELAAGGKATVSKGRWEKSGAEWVMIAGWGPGKIHFERGTDSSGINWSVDYRKADSNNLIGTTTGQVEGQDFQSTVTLTITGENTYTVTWEAKLANGEVRKAKATNTRVKRPGRGE